MIAWKSLSILFAFGMFAVSHAAERTLLFVDDHDVQYRAGLARVLHPAVRRSDQPLLTGPTPKNQVGYCSVHCDPATGKYQLWYQITGGGQLVCYAESTDGLAWTKPPLYVLTVKGVPDRNVVFTSADHYGASVVFDPRDADPQRRYKMAYWSLPPMLGTPSHPKDDRGPDGGMYVAFSPDGIHWEKLPGPTIRGTYGRSQDPPLVTEKYPWGALNSVSDVIDASYDPLRQRFVVYAKAWIDAPDGKLFWKRSIVRTESEDFVRWSTPQLVMAPDEYDGVRPAAYPGTRKGVQLHGAPVFIRHGVYFALVQVADFETHGLQPIELAISRDGVTWSRPFRDTLFLSTGAAGTFDAGRIWSNATPVILDREIRFYYGAYEHPWKYGQPDYVWDGKTHIPKSGIGLATLPLDRFAGLKPLEKLGQITLKPRSLKDVTKLTLNADATSGTIRVELLNAAGYAFPGFTKADAMPIVGDGFRLPVAWKSANVAQLPDEEIAIRVHLDHAELFSLTLE